MVGVESQDLTVNCNAQPETPSVTSARLFEGLGKLKDNYSIKLQNNCQAYALTTPRRVAIPLLPKVEAELQRMLQLGVIEQVNQPTEWCSGMVVVPKPNGSVRICVDLTNLNKNVQRERHILPSVKQFPHFSTYFCCNCSVVMLAIYKSAKTFIPSVSLTELLYLFLSICLLLPIPQTLYLASYVMHAIRINFFLSSISRSIYSRSY